MKVTIDGVEYAPVQEQEPEVLKTCEDLYDAIGKLPYNAPVYGPDHDHLVIVPNTGTGGGYIVKSREL